MNSYVDETERTMLGRVQILDAPAAAPGHCAICGTTKGPVLDFGMFMEFYGVVYLCVDNCMVELANAFDYHSPRQWRLAVDHIKDQREEINQLRDENERLRNAVGSLTDVSRESFIDRTPEFDVDEVLQEPEPEVAGNDNQLAFDFAGGEESDSKQNDESGSPDVLNHDDDFEEYFRNI